jgi:serine/threonine protein kinase
MNPLLASARMGSGLDLVERAVLSLEQEWRRHGEVRLEQFWPDRCRAEGIDPTDSMAILAELIKADLRLRFDGGQSPTVASYLEQFPKLCQTDSRVLSLIYEEFCLREESGDAPDVESFCGRYPRWKDSLVAQLKYHRLFSQAAGRQPPKPRFPVEGDCFEEFQLVSLLGCGGTSRVFLARDLSLGGKQVALKVSLDRGDEPKVHGPLDHPHIVPANSVAFQPEKHLRGLSMPYHPGLALDVVISRLNSLGRPRKAIELWHVLVDGSAKSLMSCGNPQKEALLAAEMRRTGPRGDGWEGFPTRGTFAQGAAWIAMILTRALHYAHGMGTYHRDVKPGNVLLTLRYGPQLFDFNLAESPHSAHQAHEAIHGGTLPYMAPEQIEAFLNPELWGKVGAKADVYSLGLVLRELLTGRMPELPDENLTAARAMRQVLDRRPLLEANVRRINPGIPHALDAIVTKCLAVSPDDRYRDARALAQDLERFLSHQPLLHAINPSGRERLTNWGRRHRWVLLSATANLILLGILLRKPIMEQFLPPVQSKPAFQAATSSLLDEEYDQAIRCLESLLPTYPESPLVEIYLTFALDRQKKTRDADSHYQKAVALPGGVDKLVAWGKTHPEIAPFLEDFAEARIKEADSKVTSEIFADEEEQKLFSARQWYFDVAREAVNIAKRFDHTSLRTDRILARVDEFYGDFGRAYDRVTQVLEDAKLESGRFGRLQDPDSILDLDRLLSLHALRCRIATRWVDQQRSRNNPGDPALLAEFLRQVEDVDLDYCKKHILSRDFSLDDDDSNFDNQFYKFEYLENTVRLMLVRGEIEIDLGRLPQAQKDISLAGDAKSELCRAATAPGRPAPNPKSINRRIDVASGRIHNKAKAASSAQTHDTSQSDHTGTNSG